MQQLVPFLKAAIHQEEENGTLAIIEETEADIEFDDFNDDRIRYYHLIPPTVEWLKNRFIWAPSIQGDTASWSEILAKVLIAIDPYYLMSLNRIIILEDTDDDMEAVCKQMDREPCEFPDYLSYLGITWMYESSVVVNLSAIRCGILDQSLEKGCPTYTKDMRDEFCLTILHELRHLQLRNADLFPEDMYDESEDSEELVERWAQGSFLLMRRELERV